MATLPRFDWYQSEVEVILSILKRGVSLDDCKLAYNEKNRQLVIKEKEETIFEGNLESDVKFDNFIAQCSKAKVEIRLPKANRGERWKSLLASDKANTEINAETKNAQVPFFRKNWDEIEKQAVKEEEEEQPEGDAAVNKMFQKIYRDAPDDVKKAMMKSYQESNGTVLSTNWADIRSRKVEVQPPPCMEFKKFES